MIDESATTAKLAREQSIAQAHVLRRFSADILMLAPETR
jgi:hypothetical protein